MADLKNKLQAKAAGAVKQVVTLNYKNVIL